MEPMGVVVFAVFMIASFLQVFIESAQRLLNPHLEPVFIPLIGKLVMIATIAVKGIVWVWCRRIKNSSVEALAQDAENDVGASVACSWPSADSVLSKDRVQLLLSSLSLHWWAFIA